MDALRRNSSIIAIPPDGIRSPDGRIVPWFFDPDRPLIPYMSSVIRFSNPVPRVAEGIHFLKEATSRADPVNHRRWLRGAKLYYPGVRWGTPTYLISVWFELIVAARWLNHASISQSVPDPFHVGLLLLVRDLVAFMTFMHPSSLAMRLSRGM